MMAGDDFDKKKKKKVRIIIGGKEIPTDEIDGHIKKVGEEVGSAVRSAVESLGLFLDSATTGYNKKGAASKPPSPAELFEIERNERLRYLDKVHKKTQKSVESKKKSAIFFLIAAPAVFALSGEFASLVVFSSLSAYLFYSFSEEKKKLAAIVSDIQSLYGNHTPIYNASTEKILLRHAFENKGRIYAERLAIETEFTLGQVEEILKVCQEKQLATLEVDNSGRLYYYFASLDTSDPSEPLAPNNN